MTAPARLSHLLATIILPLLLPFATTANDALPDEFHPDYEEVRAILNGDEEPMGVMFMIRGAHEQALEDMLPRLQRHLRALRARHPRLHLVAIAYCEEVRALATAARDRHPALHATLERLIADLPLDVHVCGAFAAGIDLSPDDFPPHFDVVPSSTAQYEAYRALDYLPVMMAND